MIRNQLVDLIENTFRREEVLCLACNEERAFFASEEHKKYDLWSCQKVTDALIYLLDNIYIRFGSKLYRQNVGILMGTNSAPLVADLFLFCYERDFMNSLTKEKRYDLIDAFNSTSRYLDDLLNIDNIHFELMVHNIYIYIPLKYRFPSQIDFNRCREEIASALNDFGNRWCNREGVECDAMKEWKLSIFNIVDKRIKFYSQNTNLLPPKPKSSFRHLKQGIQEFHRKYVLVPADKAANNVVVVCRLHYINTLKQDFNGTKAYEETSKDEKSVVYSHLNEIPKKFVVDVKESQDRLPTMYWLPKLHKRPYKARFIANSSSCTTTELSNLLTSCLTAIKAKVVKYCETVYERSGKNMFWPIKNSGEVLSKLKDICYQATSLSTLI